MKRAKLMLATIAIVGVFGATFAFNTHRFTCKYIYTGAFTAGNHICTTEVDGRAISNSCGAPAVYASVLSNITNCPPVFTFAVSDN